MKKFILLATLQLAFFGGYAQCTFGTGDICQNFINNHSSCAAACCASPTTNHNGCPPANGAPINSALVLLILAGGVIGTTMVGKYGKAKTGLA